MDGFQELNQVLSSMDTNGTSTQDPGTQQPNAAPAQQQTQQVQTPTIPPVQQQQTAPEQQVQQPQQTQQPAQNSQQNAAFAQMRIQNANYESLIKRMGENLGIKDNTIEGITASLNNQLTQQEAQKMNVSPEIMQTLQQQAQFIQQIQEQQAKTQLATAAHNLQSQFNLNAQQIMDFASELDTLGIDMLTNSNNLVAIYRGLHFDELQAKAVQDAMTNKNAAANTSATINQQSGQNQDPNQDQKITTVAGLHNFLKDVNI